MDAKNKTIIFSALFALALVLSAQLLNAQAKLPDYNEKTAENLRYFEANPNNEFISNPGAGYPVGWNSGHQWLQLSMYAIAACLLVNILIYMLGYVLSLQKVQAFAVSEFYQATASALLVFFMVFLLKYGFAFLQQSSILPIGTTTLAQCTGGQVDVWQVGPPEIIRCNIAQKIGYVEALMQQAKAINSPVEKASSICFITMGFTAWCNDWDSSIHNTMEKAHYLANKLVPIGISLHAQYMFIAYIATAMLQLFLPVGILLRIVPIFRGIGGLMIAISLGFYFVFPIVYIILDPSTQRPEPTSIIPNLTAGNNAGACYISFSGIVSTSTELQKQLTQQGTQTGDVSQLGDEISKLYIEAFFNPLVALGACLIFITAIAPFLGGDSGEIMHFIAKVI